ncbi:LAMI_0F06744g1_1 [Lachancea mirantina]|uniref:LAMI_0F06744g1_1 n=1 Tax=Lachancea mirantina TaxID=1230905 RepID=A0A1G4JZ38_9SACH|nr:LAMI_0F06744g1_1 [Lachancea mirantina]
MSFTATLAICGVGALAFKYCGQEAVIDEDFPRGKENYPGMIFKQEMSIIAHRFHEVTRNFWREALRGDVYLFPLKGIVEMLSNFSYVWSWLKPFIVYLTVYTIILLIYFATVLPVYLAILGVLGPLGLVLAYLHFLLHANMLSMMIMRMSQLNVPLFFKTLQNKKKDAFINRALHSSQTAKRFYIPMNTGYYWLNYMPWRIVVYSITSGVVITLVLLSFVPILGPAIFSAAISPVISRIYFSKYLRLKKLDNRERQSRFYAKFGGYSAFGFVAGQLETLPIVSGLIYSSNMVGVGLLAEKELDELETVVQRPVELVGSVEPAEPVIVEEDTVEPVL